MASEEHTSESLLIQAREAEIIGSTGPGNEFHTREMRKVEAGLGPDFVTHGDIHESEIVVQGNDATLGTAAFLEAPSPKKVAFEDIHKASEDALHNKIQDQGQFGEEISIVHENIDLTSCIEVSEILQDEKSTELMELVQEINEVNADAALETVICDEEESREMITQVGNLKVHPYVTSQSEIGEIIEDRMERRLSEAEEIPLASQMGDFALLTDATLQATVEKERIPDVEETDKDQMLNLGQTRTALEEVGIEHDESHPRNDSESTEEIEDVISEHQNEVETKSESIEKVESIILNKELDGSENVLVTQNEHAIPKIFDKEKDGLILRQASHPSSEATLQPKLESSEMSGEKNQISQEYWFENDQAPCVENLDDQGEPSSDECLRTKDAEMTLLVESSEAINVKCIAEEQQGVTDEAKAKDYDKPSNEFSEYIEQDDFDKQGQDFISVEETREGQTEEGKDFTEKESLLTETELKGMSRSTCISVQDKNANELHTAPPLVDQIGEHEVKQQEQDPRNEEVEEWELVSETNKEYNATEQENILETNVSEESIESEMGNITLISRYDNMDGTEKQRAIHDTDTSATKELNVTPKDGTQQTKFTEEIDEYIGGESPIHDNEQEDARGQMNSELSGVKDETSDNGDNENSAEEMQIDTDEEFTENNKVKGTLADCLTEKVAEGYQDDEKEDLMLSQEAAKAEQEDISVSSLAVKHETSGEGEYFDLSRVEDEATSIGNNENTAVDPNKKMTKDNTDDGLEVYELHEKTFDNLAALRQEVGIEDEYFSNNSLDVKDETGAEAENEHLMRLKGELGENEDNKFLTDIQEVNNISEGTISQDNAREEQKIQMEDVPQESLAEKIISQSENTVENVMQMKHTSDEFVEISGTSPESPAKELVVGHSDDREAKKFPEEIVENLSIVSKELEIEQSEQSIDSSIEKNETAAEGEDEELAEHQADDNVAKESAFEVKSENFQDDKAKEQISKPEDVSPELMEENIHPQNYTEESQVQTEDTSRQFTEDENVKGCLPEHSVSESHIQDAKETKEFHEEKYENRCIESLELEKEQECQIQDFSEDETRPGGSDETLKVQENLKDGNSIENYPKAGSIVSENENADEEKVQSEDSSKIFTEDDHVTSTGERVESNVNDSKVVEELSEEQMSAKGDTEKLTAETSPKDGKIIEEPSYVEENIISAHNETVEEKMQVDDTNEQSPEESNLVDTPPESLAKEMAEASSGDGHEAKGRTSEQYEEESNLDTPSQSLEKKKAETSTDEGDIEKDVTEDIKTSAGENFPVEYADDEREPKDLSHDSSILNHATIAMEDNEAMEEEHKLLNEHITGEASLSAGHLIQHDDSIDAVNIQNEDAPEKCIEESTIPQDDKNEEQNAQIEDNNEELRKDEHATNISPGYPIQEVLQRTANDGKEEKEYNEKKCETFLTESTETESNNEVTKLNSSIPDDESANKNVEKLTADEDVQDEIIIYKAPSAITAGVIQDDTASSKGEEYLANSVSPDDEGIDQKALAKDKTRQETGTGKQIDKLADLDICEEHDQMQKEETPEQSDEIRATRDDEKLRVEASPKDEKIIEETSPVAENVISQNDETKEEMQMEGTNEKNPEESNLVDTPFEPQEEKTTETSTDDEHEAKESTEEVTITAGEKFSIEHAEVVREPKELDHDSSISNHATITTEDNEGEIVEQKLEDQQTPREAYISEGTAIHQDDSSYAVKIQKEAAPEKSIAETATSITPEYPIEEALQRTTNDGEEENKDSEQKCESPLLESNEVEEACEGAKLKSSVPNNETANESVELTEAENVKDENVSDKASSAITDEVIQDNISLFKGKEFPADSLSVADEDIDQKAVLKDKTEQSTYTGTEIDELANLDESDKYNDQMGKEGTPEKFEEMTEDYKMETTQEELTKEYNTGISVESPDEKIVNISADNGEKESELNEEISENGNDQKLTAELLPDDEKRIEEASLAKETAETSTENDHKSTEGTSEQYKEENYRVDTPSESLEAKETETSTDDGHEANDITEEVTTMGKSISIEEEVVKEPEDLDHDSLASRSATTTIEDNEGVTVEQKHKDEQAMGEAYLSAGNTILHDNNIDVVKIQNEDAPEKRMEESTTLQNDKNEEHNAHIEDKIEELTIKEHATSISPEYPIEEVLQSTTNDGEEEKEGSEQKLESFLTESTEIETSNENVKKFIAENVRDESIIDEASSAITDEVDQNDVALCKGEEFLAASASPDDEGIYQKVLPNDKTEQATDTGKEIHELVDLDKSEKLNDEMQKETSEQSVNMTEEYRMETTHIQLTREYSTGTSAESPDEKIVVDADNVKKETDFNEESNVNQINQSVEHTAVGADHEDLGFQISDPENAASTKGEKEELMEKSPDQENIIEDTSPSAGYSIPCDDQKLIAEASPEDEKRILEASHAKETTETSTENEHASVDGTGEQLNVENYHVDTPSESSEAKETETSTDDGHEAKEMREEVTTEASPDDEKEIVEASLAKEMAETREALPDDLKRIEEASLAKETAETSTENDHESMECTSEQCKEEDYHVDTPSESLEAKETERSTDDGHEAKDLCYQTSDPENATNTKGENEELTKKRTDRENIIEDTSTSAVHSIPCDDQNLLAEASPEDEKRLVEASLAKETAETSTENGHESIDGTSEPPTAENYHVDTPSESSEAKETEKSIDDGREAKEIREEITKEASPEDEKEIVEASLAKEMAETSTENGQESMESTSKALPDDEKRIDEASLAKETAETSTENDHESTEGTSEQYKEENYHVDTPSESLEGKESETSTGDGHEANDITEEVTTMGQSISIEDEVVKEPEDLDHDSLATRTEDAPEKSIEESATLQNDKNEEKNAQIEDKGEELTLNEHATNISPEYPIEEVLQWTTNDGEEEKDSEQKLESFLTENTEIERNPKGAKLESSIPINETSNENVKNFTAENVSDENKIDEASSAITAELDQDEAAVCKDEESVAVCLSPDDEGIDQKALPNDKTEQATDTGKEIDDLTDLDKSEKHDDKMQKETSGHSGEMTEEYGMETTHEDLTREYNTGTSTEFLDEKIINDADYVKKKNELNEKSDENQSVERAAVGADHEDLGFQTSDPGNATSTKGENEELTEKSPDKEKITEDISLSAGYSVPRDDRIEERKVKIEDVTHESVEGNTVSQHDDTEQDYMEKDQISQQIEGSHATVTSAEIPVKISNESSTVDENKTNASITEERKNLGTQENNETLTAQNDAQEEIIQVSSAITAEQMPDNASIYNTEQFLSTDSSEGKGIEQTSEHNMAEDKSEQTADVLSKMGQTATTNQIEEQNHQIQREEITEQLIEETDIVTINDQTREPTENEVSEENFGKANADERNTEQNKEIVSIPETEGSEKEIVLETTAAHVEASSTASDVDCIFEEHEESLSLGQNVDSGIQVSGIYTTEQAADEGHAVPDEVPDARERNYYNDEVTIEPIKEVEGGTTEATETVNEGLVADALEKSDTEMQMESEGQVEADFIKKFHEDDQVNIPSQLTTDSKFSGPEEVKITEEGNSRALEGDDTMIYESRKDNLEDEENQDDFARVQESALQTETVTVISEKDGPVTKFNGSIQEVENSASAEMVEQKQQYEASNPKTDNFLGEENHNSDSLVEKHEMAIGTEKENEKLSEHPSDSNKEDTAEKRSQNDEDALKEEAESSLEVEGLINKAEDENKVTEESALIEQVLLEPEGKDGVKFSIQTSENRSDATDLQQDQMKTVMISPESGQEEGEDAVYSDSTSETQSSNITKTPCNEQEASPRAETLDECTLLEEKGEHPDKTTIRENELSEERINENLESDDLVKKIEHDTTSGNEEANKNLTEHPFVSTIKDVTEERQQNDEVIQTDERETTIADQVPVEHEDEMKEKGIHKTAENQIDTTYLQLEETKTVTSTESSQKGEQKVIDLNSITEADSSEPSTVEKTENECHFPEERCQSSINSTKKEDEPSEERTIKENLISDTVVKKHENEIASSATNEKPSSYPSDLTKEDIIEERLRNNDAAPTEEVASNLNTNSTVNREASENEVTENLIITDQVLTGPANVDNVRSIQETTENQIDDNHLEHDEIKQKAIDATNITENESSDITETPYKQPEALAVEKTAEECGLEEERGLSSQNNTEGNNEPSKKIINEVSMDPEDENKVLSIQEAADNQNDANELLHKEIKTGVSFESVTNGKEMATDSNYIPETEISDKMETPYNNSDASIIVRTLEECGVPEGTGQSPENYSIREQQQSQINKEEVVMEPEDEDEAKIIQELLERRNDITDLQHDEMQAVTSSESVQNENAMNFDKTTETENLDKMDMLCNESKISNVVNTLEECDLSEERNKVETVEAERSLKQTHWEEEITCFKTSSSQKSEQTVDNFEIIGNEEGGRTDLNDIQTTDYHLPVTCKRKGNDDVEVELPAEGVAKQIKVVPTEAHKVMEEGFIQIKENPVIERMVSNSIEEETTCVSPSYNNWKHFEEIIKNEMEADEPPPPNEEDEPLQGVSFEEHSASTEGMGKIEADLKSMSNETEEQQFSELVLYEQKHKGSLLTEEIAEENMERVQQLEEKNTGYSSPEQVKDKNLHEEVPREPDVQNLDFDTSKSLQQKEDVAQEASKTDPEIIMQPRDFSSQIQYTVFSTESEKTTEIDTFIHSYLQETKDVEKVQATGIPDGKLENLYKETTDVDSQLTGSLEQIHEPHDELNISEETTNTCEKHMAKNSDTTTEELSTEEGSKLCNVIVNEVPYDQIGKGHEVIAKTNQVEEDKGDAKKCHQVAREYSQEERGIDDVLLRSEKNLMETVERKSSTREHKGKDNLQVVSTEDLSASQQTEKPQEVSISEETTNTYEKHKAKNSDITIEELSTDEGSKLRNVIVNEGPYDQIGKGDEVVAKTNQVEEDKGDTKKYHQLAREYTQEERGIDDVLLRSEKNFMETLERESSTREHKAEDYWQVVSAEDVSASQQTEKAQEVLIEGLAHHGEIEEKQYQMQAYSIKIEETGKTEIKEEDVIRRAIPEEKEEECEEAGLIAATITEGSKEMDVKAHHKKSHNLLSGVGSRVKQSISKVKKAITGKPSQPKNPSPKKATAKGE